MSSSPLTTDYVLDAMISESSGILKLLGSLLIEEKPTAIFELSEIGIRVVVQKNKVIEGFVCMACNCFDEFKFNHPSQVLTLFVDLRYLLKCLGVLSSASTSSDHSSFVDHSRSHTRPSIGRDLRSLRIRLETADSPLVLLMDDETESESQIRATIATQEPATGTNTIIFPDITSEDAQARISIKSELLLDLWDDLDRSSEKLWIKISNGDSCLTFITKSEIAEVELSVPRDKLNDFNFKEEEDIVFCFRLALFKMTISAIRLSQKAILMFANGRLVIGLSILEDVASGEHLQWAQYTCTSLSEEDTEIFKIASKFRLSLNSY